MQKFGLLAAVAVGVLAAGCGSDDNVVQTGTVGRLSGTVTFPAGGTANSLIIGVGPVPSNPRSMNEAAFRQFFQDAINRGQLRNRVYSTQGVSNLAWQFDDLPTGEYAVYVKPTNLTGQGTATESNMLGRSFRAFTDQANSTQLISNTQAATASLTVTANPPSGTAPTVTFTQNLIGFTDNAPPGDVVVGDFILQPEGSDRIFEIGVRTSAGPTSVISATFTQNSNWGARTQVTSLNGPDTVVTEVEPGTSRGLGAVYTYQR